MSLELKMEPVANLPLVRARRGYADQAGNIRQRLLDARTPMLVATAPSRNSLESLSRHLRDHDDIECVVNIHERDAEGQAVSYALFAEARNGSAA